jgi:hypothetical protein
MSVRATLPSLGPAQGYGAGVAPSTPYGTTLIPYHFHNGSTTLTIEHLTDYTPPSRGYFRRKIQQSGSLNVFVVGSNVEKIKQLSINAQLWADDVSSVAAKYEALDAFISAANPIWFGRNGWYYTGYVIDGVRTQIRLGGNASTVLPVSIEMELIFPRATNGRPTTLSGYNALSKKFLLEENYPIPATGFAWVSGATLPNAPIGEFYAQQVVAVGDNQPITYSLVTATNPDITVMSNGFIVWPEVMPIPDNVITVTVRATDSASATLDRTFTINVPGNIYTNGGLALSNGGNLLGWGL